MNDIKKDVIKKTENLEVSIVIPAFNEDATIGIVLDDLKKVMDSSLLKYEIIVIDDGSVDKTADIVKGKKGIHLIQNESNEGYGASLKIGIRNSAFDKIVIIDGDNTYPVDMMPKLLNYTGEFDMVVASRTGDEISMPSLRKFAKSILNNLANYLSGKKIPDLNSGFRIIKKDVLIKFFNILPAGFSFTTTITLALLTNNYPVKYVPINYHHRNRRSKFHPVKDTIGMLVLILRTILYFNPLKIFTPLSFFLIGLGIVIFALSAVFLPKPLDITATLLIITGIQTIVTGLLADLINKKLS